VPRVLLPFFDTREVFLRHVEEILAQIRAQPQWRLVRDLDSVLEHGDWECRRGHTREPQAKVAVTLLVVIRLPTLNNQLEIGQPRDRKVAILRRGNRIL
jgi:hypothetical protein